MMATRSRPRRHPGRAPGHSPASSPPPAAGAELERAAVTVAAALGVTVAPRVYGPADDPVTRLMAAGRRVALRSDGYHLDGQLVTAAALAEAAAALPARSAYGHAVDPSDLTLRAACPSCGGPSVCGWRERDRLSGRWREVRTDPGPCLACAVAATLGQADAPAQSSAPDAGSASWRVHGRAVAISAGVLTIDGRQVAADVTPAAVAIYGRRLFAAGRPVADLAACPGRNQL